MSLIAACQVYIVKDSWRDSDRPLEGHLYVKGEGIGHVHSFGTVQLNDGDDTTMAVRRGLQAHGGPVEIDALQQTSDDTSSASSPYRDVKVQSKYTSSDFLPELDSYTRGGKELTQKQRHELHGRAHSRHVMSTYGLPIKRARCLLEMVGAMRDAIVGE